MIVVRTAEARDTTALAELFEELDRFLGATDIPPLDLRLRQIDEALFGPARGARALLGWDGEMLIGLAAYSYLWPAVGLTRSIFLKELYVVERHRRQGVGQALMQHLAAIAAEEGCSRVEWMTDVENEEPSAPTRRWATSRTRRRSSTESSRPEKGVSSGSRPRRPCRRWRSVLGLALRDFLPHGTAPQASEN